MSRSYKKTPVHKSSNCKKDIKRLAAKAVRNCNDVQSGKWYRKLYPSWDINDWVDYTSWDEYCNSQFYTNPYYWIGRYLTYAGYGNKEFNNPDRNEWEKGYRRK